jgi:hypothetical protein
MIGQRLVMISKSVRRDEEVLPLSSKLDILDTDSMSVYENAEAHRGVEACSGAKRLHFPVDEFVFS